MTLLDYSAEFSGYWNSTGHELDVFFGTEAAIKLMQFKLAILADQLFCIATYEPESFLANFNVSTKQPMCNIPYACNQASCPVV